MAKEDTSKTAVIAALADLDLAFTAAVSAIRTDSNPRRAYREATELVETVQRLLEAAGDLRAQSAARIVKAEGLSLAGLAERISVSKARAAQLINTAKKSERTEHTEEETK